MNPHSTISTISKPLPAPGRPFFLVRHAWFGFFLFLFGAVGLAWLSFQVTVGGIFSQPDQSITQSIHTWAQAQSVPVTLFMRIMSSVGRDGLTLFVFILFVIWIRRKRERELGMIIVGVLGGELWFQILSNLINRSRPEIKDPFETLIGPGFPSGHATTTLLLAWVILSLLLPRIHSGWGKLLLILFNLFMIVSIDFSRLFLGLHYPTDIVGGLLLGLAWGGLSFTLIDLYFSHRLQKETAGEIKTN